MKQREVDNSILTHYAILSKCTDIDFTALALDIESAITKSSRYRVGNVQAIRGLCLQRVRHWMQDIERKQAKTQRALWITGNLIQT